MQRIAGRWPLSATIGLRLLVHRRSRLASALLGALFAAYLMATEAGLLTVFMSATSRMVRAVDADLWLGAPGLPAFDFASGISTRHAELAMAAPGARVAGVANVTWAPLTRSDGARRMVMVVGVDAPFLGQVPNVVAASATTGVSGRVLMVDASDARTLGIERLPAEVELGCKRARKRVLSGDPADKADRDVMEIELEPTRELQQLPVGYRVTVQIKKAS